MRNLHFVLFLTLLLLPSVPFAADSKTAREVRTYLPFTFPVEPARIKTVPDTTISNALATSLVEWDDQKEITKGVAESWKMVSPKLYRFTLNRNARWSDGSPITATQVKQSLDRSIKINVNSLQSIVQLVESIEIHSDRELDFKLKILAQETELPEKLARAQFGIVKVTTNEQIDLSVGTGPYVLLPTSSRAELVLIRNPEWLLKERETSIPNQVTIRRPPKDLDSHAVLISDPWPNLIEALSIASSTVTKKYNTEKFEIWKSPLTHFLSIQLGKETANTEGQSLIRFLRSNLILEEVANGLSGYSIATQVFPHGYPLFSHEFSCSNQMKEPLPRKFQYKPLNILISPTRIHSQLKENLQRFITRVTGNKPNFISVPLEEVYERMSRGGFDLYAGTSGIADPSVEQTISSYLEGKIPLVFSMGNTFLQRLDSARKEKNDTKKNNEMRSILRDAICDGHVLPLFHAATIAIGRPYLDLQFVPSSDEAITFSKIRFREVD